MGTAGGTHVGHPEAMHRWDSSLRPPPPGVTPVRHRDVTADPTRAQLRSPAWRRSSHGCYVPSSVELTPGQRIVEGAALLPPDGAISGWGSAYWRGARLLDGSTGVRRQELLLCLGPSGKLRNRPAVTLSRERLPPEEVEDIRGVPCTVPLRLAFDGARLATDLVEAVIFLDMVLTSQLIQHSELHDYIEQCSRWRGIGQARKAVALAVEGSRSPPETRLRLAWVLDAQLPTPLVNPPVFDKNQRMLGYPDALEVESGCALEYDGDDHRDIHHHTADNAREEVFEDHGLIVTRATRLDLRADRRPDLVGRMRRAYGRGLRRDRRHDQWTLQAPPWW